ncbi:MAG: hypothetical protein KBD28_03550 [Chitinophagaceae bacterium]|nr:hypothetical protein [Chitinophagaceae bacterium]
MAESSIKKSGVYGIFGKRYGDILINVLQGCCNGVADFGNVCTVVKDCIGIDEVNGNSNLFLNQKGEFISITGGVITGTYSDFQTLISNNDLKQGSFYLMTDYETIYDQPDYDNAGSIKSTLTLKVGAVEPILLFATSSNTFAKEVWSTIYPKDKLQYNISVNATFFSGSPCKGRIVERIDEWNNRTDYDHREIKFIRYDDGAGNFTQINDSGRTSQEFLTFVQNFTGGIVYDNWLGDFYSIGALVGQEYPNNVFSGEFVISNTSSALFYNNTFSGDNVTNNTFSDNVYNNTFSDNVNNTTFGYVNNNTFNGEVSNNTFGNVHNNTISGNVYSNTFDNVYNNTFSGDVSNNTFGYVHNNTISGNVYSNTFDNVYNNTFSGDVSNNTFGYVSSNTFNGDVSNNTFSDDVYNNTFSGDVSNNTFGYVSSNTFNGDVSNNTFSGYVNSNTFTYTGILQYVTIADDLQSKTIDDVTYPFLFNTNYKKEILQASNGNTYARYFDGTNDVNTLIP